MVIKVKIQKTFVFFRILVIIVVINLASSPAFGAAPSYTIQKITDNSSDSVPAINNKGQVAFGRHNGNDWDVYLYDNGTIKKISSNSYDDINENISWGIGAGPGINDNGQIVWSGFDGAHWQIYSWINGVVKRITDGNFDETGPVNINKKGRIVWTRSWFFFGGLGDIRLYENGNIISLTNDNKKAVNAYAHINDNDFIAWSHSHPNFEIYLYNGTEKQRITLGNNENVGPRINVKNQIVFQFGFQSVNNIALYSNGSITPLTSNNYNSAPDINDAGQIVWAGNIELGGNLAIFLYSNGQTFRLTEYNNPPWLLNSLRINNNGQIVWKGPDGLYLASPPTPPPPPSKNNSPAINLLLEK